MLYALSKYSLSQALKYLLERLIGLESWRHGMATGRRRGGCYFYYLQGSVKLYAPYDFF